ncbi:MAG: hypothetical protein ACF8XB_14140 [Planctomycetota bacterium JB042]
MLVRPPIPALLLAGLAACSAPDVPPPELVGAWAGDARVIVEFCEADTIPIRLDIRADGTVTGSVGDAALVDAAYHENRGALGRKLKVATDHIVSGKLDGPLIAAENVTRRAIDIPFDLKFGRLDGGFHSSGAHVGPPSTMKVSGTFALARE